MIVLLPLSPHRALECIAVAVPLGILLAIWFSGRLWFWLHPRPQQVREVAERDFAAYFEGRGLDRQVAATSFRYLREMQGVSIPVLPGDHLGCDLGLSEAQIEQTLADLARRLERDLDGIEAWPATAEQLVVLLSQAPRRTSFAAASLAA